MATMLVASVSGARAQDTAAASPLAGWRYETWFQFRNNSESSDGSQQGKATLRLYQPFELGQGWRLTMREDIFGINTNQEGQDNRDQQWRSNIGDIFVQGSLATPPIATDLNADLGMRVVFPTGGLKPFGDGYYQLAPHFGLDFQRVGGFEWLAFAPLARYFRTVGATVPHGTDISQVQFHPVVAVRFAMKGGRCAVAGESDHRRHANQRLVRSSTCCQLRSVYLSVGLGGAVRRPVLCAVRQHDLRAISVKSSRAAAFLQLRTRDNPVC